MKALIRKPGETITENNNVPGIDWNTGYPLVNPKWFGGPYQLVDNYVEVTDGAIYDVVTYPESEEEPEEEVTVTEDTVIIDGKEYSKEELRALLGE